MNAKKDNKLCSCERESTDELCYKKKIDPTEKNMYYALLADMNNERNRYNKSVKICLHPISGECSSEKSGAHTISNSSVLKLIAPEGKVMMPIMYNLTGKLKMDPVGINEATKLNCFCKKHDEMFHPIDEEDVRLDTFALFLYAYRAFAGTYYKMKREIKILERLSNKYDFTKLEYIVSFQKSMKKWLNKLEECKRVFNESIIANDYKILNSYTYTLPYRAYFAVSSCFPIIFDAYGTPIIHKNGKMQLMYISIIPHDKNTQIIFSWLKSDDPLYAEFKRQLSIIPESFFLKFLNNLLPLSCENIVISPRLWDNWSKEAQDEFKHKAQYGWPLRSMPAAYFHETEYDLFENLDDEKA